MKTAAQFLNAITANVDAWYADRIDYETFGALHGEVSHFIAEMDGSGTEVLVPPRGEAVTL